MEIILLLIVLGVLYAAFVCVITFVDVMFEALFNRVVKLFRRLKCSRSR